MKAITTFFTKNIGTKILATIVACGLWFYASASESKISTFPGNIKIETKNISEGLVPIYDQTKVKIKIQTSYQTWNRLTIDNFQAYVDLAGLDAGTYEEEVKVTSLDPSVLIMEKDPSKIIVRLETLQVKEVPVKVLIEGEAKSGYVPEGTEVTPENVKASGAKSIVENLSEAIARIPLKGDQTEDFEKNVKLGADGEKQGISFEPDNVKVKVFIVKATESKTVGIKARIKGKPKSGFYVSSIKITPSVLEISGSASSLKSILSLETEEVDIEGISQDFKKEVGVSLPQGVSSTEKKVLVEVFVSSQVVEREITAALNYLNLGANLKVKSVSPSIIKVVITGPQDLINSLSSDKVIVNFDLKDKNVGSFQADIKKEMIQIPENCSISSWLPQSVTIELEKT